MFGLDDLLDSAFSWATDAIGSGLNAGLDSLGLSQHGRDQYFNRSMMREQMEWQSAEAQKNRDWNLQMYERQLQNYPELLKMQADSDFNKWKNQQDYMSPQNMVSRNLAAGVNPTSQGQALTQGVSSSASVPPNIAGSPVGNPSPVGIPSTGMSRGLLSEIGSFMRDVQQARNLEKQTGRYDEYLDSIIAKFDAETENKEEATRYQKILTAIKQVYGNTEALYTNAKLLQEAYSAQKRGDFEVANKKLAEADANLSRKKGAEIDERLPFIKGEMQTQIDLNRANRRKALAEADEALSRKELNKANKELADIAIKVKNNETTPQILEQHAKTILAKLEREEKISDKDKVEAERRIEKLAGIKRTRENAGIISRAVDDFFSWWTDHISTAVTGGVHASVSDNNSHSSVKYE